MDRIPDYCKVGIVVSASTALNALLYSFIITQPLIAPVPIMLKAYLIGFPVVGYSITAKKMYDYHRGTQAIANDHHD